MTNVTQIREANGHELNGHQADFEEFWDLFPAVRRVRKALCRAKWDKIISEKGLKTKTLDKDAGQYTKIRLKATPEEIIEGLMRSRKLWQGKGEQRYGWEDDGKYIPMASTWLNQGRWMD
jgi:hypothetical protein